MQTLPLSDVATTSSQPELSVQHPTESCKRVKTKNQDGEAKRRAVLLECEKVGDNVSVTGTFAVILREITARFS